MYAGENMLPFSCRLLLTRTVQTCSEKGKAIPVDSFSFGISTGCFYYTGIFTCLEMIRSGGFDMIEICSVPDHLDYHDTALADRVRKRLESLELRPVSFHAPFSDSINYSSSDPSVREHSFSETCAAVRAAELIGAKYCVIHPGSDIPCPHAETYLDRMKQTVDMLNRIADCFLDRDISIILENMLPHLLFGRPEDMLWIIGALEKRETGLCLDTGHAALSGDLPGITWKYASYTRLVHINDNSGAGDDHLPPGRGTIDWNKFMRIMEETGFNGPLIIELAGRPDRDPSLVMAEARQARELLRGAGER
jgi:sugar phosphate isomerase/epimerase